MCLTIDRERTKQAKRLLTGEVLVKKSLKPIYDISSETVKLCSPILENKFYRQGYNHSNRSFFDDLFQRFHDDVNRGIHVYLNETDDSKCEYLSHYNITCKFVANWEDLVAIGKGYDLVFKQVFFDYQEYNLAIEEALKRLDISRSLLK